jgi:NAD(P)H dehydrogenase (quinone)
MKVDEITGGAPYGAAPTAGLDARRQPSENELADARH